MDKESALTANHWTTFLLGIISIATIILFYRRDCYHQRNNLILLSYLFAASLITALVTCVWLVTSNQLTGTHLNYKEIQCQLIFLLFQLGNFAVPYITVIVVIRTSLTFSPGAKQIVGACVTWFLVLSHTCEEGLRREECKGVYQGAPELSSWVVFIVFLVPALSIFGLSLAVFAKACRMQDSIENKLLAVSRKRVGKLNVQSHMQVIKRLALVLTFVSIFFLQ